MPTNTDWIAVVREIGPSFAERAAAHDAEDSFVAENYAALKERGFFAAGVPGELGGGDASHSELCAIVRELARYCGSTALSFSMHTHNVATQALSWRGGNKAPEPLLRRIAAEKLVLATSGGSDWLAGSGKLVKVEGGFRMSGRKIFSSGVPSANFFTTTGIYDDPQNGPTLCHFAIPLPAEGFNILDTWRVHGMRGTGSTDVELKDVFIPDAAMGGVKRTPGKWHPFLHLVTLSALPIVYAAYLGVAESAREIALNMAKKKKDDVSLPYLVGEMDNFLTTAQVVHASMVEMVKTTQPGPETTSVMAARRTIVGQAILRTAEKALEVAGGAGFYRSAHLERLLRDVQASRFHPLQEKAQLRLTGRLALGLDIDG
ncbi:MAG TPA: acyl-CoA dehydrogenase family protein [Polyangiaceae bacterium]|nr:acyl-CoA dehydrogenase family protein [Polyangiaceae bacterium]